jgi:prepilin-type processing-associated H-X9-DG protein
VVIGIIAVLIGILMPTLGTARRSALVTQCLATQRQIGVAAQMHVLQHRGYYPIAGLFSGLTYPDPLSLRDTSKQKYKYLYVDDIDGTDWQKWCVAPWHAALATNLGKRQAVLGQNNGDYAEDEVGIRDYLKYFLCPADVAKSMDAPQGNIYQVGSMYWWLQQSFTVNEAVFGVNDSYGRLRGQASKIRNPSQTIMLADGKPAKHYSNSTLKWITLVNKTKTPPVTVADALVGNAKAGTPASFDVFRHKGKVNLLFIDGHAETRMLDPRDLSNVYLLAAS